LKAILSVGLVMAGLAFSSRVQAKEPEKRENRMSDDMRRAIEFQRRKDAADARQARIEARRPTVESPNANREMEETPQPGRRIVKDPGEPAWQREKR
jgi:hypothetical protein